MPTLKRDVVKYVRDGAKSKYKKDDKCYICSEIEELDFHHYYSMTPLLNAWLKKTGYDPKFIKSVRDEFIEEHHKEVYEDTVTLCHTHHLKLHSIYGKNPGLHTATKQMRWVEIQREKHELVR